MPYEPPHEPTNGELFREIEDVKTRVGRLEKHAKDEAEFRAEIRGGRKVMLWIFAATGWLVTTAVVVWTSFGKH